MFIGGVLLWNCFIININDSISSLATNFKWRFCLAGISAIAGKLSTMISSWNTVCHKLSKNHRSDMFSTLKLNSVLRKRLKMPFKFKCLQKIQQLYLITTWQIQQSINRSFIPQVSQKKKHWVDEPDNKGFKQWRLPYPKGIGGKYAGYKIPC